MKFFQDFVFTLHKFWADVVFNRVFQTLCNHGLVRNFSSFFLSFLIGAWASNKLNINSWQVFIHWKVDIIVLIVLVGENIRGYKKLELRVSIKLFIESEISVLKSPKREIILDDSFCNFSNKGETFICKIINRKCWMFIYQTTIIFWTYNLYKSWFNFSWVIDYEAIP